ncbi:MAG TPA: hypothetical protein O0X34_02590, partial [Methanocorpusculum sp.]|nr:hypothetical protein [Methanocorpusculum sp.]
DAQVPFRHTPRGQYLLIRIIILMVLTMYHWDIVGIQTRSRSDINEQIIFRLGNIIIITELISDKILLEVMKYDVLRKTMFGNLSCSERKKSLLRRTPA